MAQQTAIMKRDEYSIEIRRMAQDIKDLLPNGNKLQDFEALALAHSAQALRLNPFTGEIWFIPGHGLMAGIKGHRRTAHEQIERAGGAASSYWPEFDLMTPDQKKQYLIPDNALGFICRLYDTVTLRTYSETVERLFKAGAPWADIKHIIGDRPYTIGIGFYQSGEQTRMKPHQCGMKRAEADALKRRFDLPFEGGAGTVNDADADNGGNAQGEFTVETPEEIQARMQTASKSLRGDQGDIDLGPEWPPTEYSANTATAKVMTDRPGVVPELVHEPPMPEPPEQSTQPIPAKSTNEPIAKRATISAAIRKSFMDWCNYWVMNDSRAVKYAAEGGGVNMYHILGRVGKLGFAGVTAENVEAVKAKLQEHIEKDA